VTDDIAVDLARLAGRIDAMAGDLSRIDQACERRAAGHVDRDLYASERKTLREDLRALSERATKIERDMDQRIAGLAAEVAETRREDARTRRWLISTVVTIVIGTATVLVGVVT
jgi:transposase